MGRVGFEPTSLPRGNGFTDRRAHQLLNLPRWLAYFDSMSPRKLLGSSPAPHVFLPIVTPSGNRTTDIMFIRHAFRTTKSRVCAQQVFYYASLLADAASFSYTTSLAFTEQLVIFTSNISSQCFTHSWVLNYESCGFWSRHLWRDRPVF